MFLCYTEVKRKTGRWELTRDGELIGRNLLDNASVCVTHQAAVCGSSAGLSQFSKVTSLTFPHQADLICK